MTVLFFPPDPYRDETDVLTLRMASLGIAAHAECECRWQMLVVDSHWSFCRSCYEQGSSQTICLSFPIHGVGCSQIRNAMQCIHSHFRGLCNGTHRGFALPHRR